jgi:hypothetical protein
MSTKNHFEAMHSHLLLAILIFMAAGSTTASTITFHNSAQCRERQQELKSQCKAIGRELEAATRLGSSNYLRIGDASRRSDACYKDLFSLDSACSQQETLERSQARQREIDESRREAAALRQRNELEAQQAKQIRLSQEAYQNMQRAEAQQRALTNARVQSQVARTQAATSAAQGILGLIIASKNRRDDDDDAEAGGSSTSSFLEQARQAEAARQQEVARQQAEQALARARQDALERKQAREAQEALERKQARDAQEALERKQARDAQEALERKQARDAGYDALLGGLGSRLLDAARSTITGAPLQSTSFDRLKVLNPPGDRNPFSVSGDAAQKVGVTAASNAMSAVLNQAIVSSNGLGTPVDNSFATAVDASVPSALERVHALNPFGGQVASLAIRAGTTIERQVFGQATSAMEAAEQLGRNDGAGSASSSTRWLGVATSLPVNNPFSANSQGDSRALRSQEPLPPAPAGMTYFREPESGQVWLRPSSSADKRGDQITPDGQIQCSTDGLGVVLRQCESRRVRTN